MIYEITSIDPGEGARDVLLTVSYWYDDNANTNSKPDFVEHHRIISIPSQGAEPARNELGHYLRTDGSLEPAWRLQGDEWSRWHPDPDDPNYQWISNSTDDPAAVIQSAVERRAQEVKKQGRKGQDLFDVKPVHPEKPASVMKQADVRALQARRGII